MTKFYIAAFAAVSLSLPMTQPAHAGWFGLFGPNTYDECVLDSMKGRPQFMLPTVQSDCRTKFCKEDENVSDEELGKIERDFPHYVSFGYSLHVRCK
jgi:hypothetical protein